MPDWNIVFVFLLLRHFDKKSKKAVARRLSIKIGSFGHRGAETQRKSKSYYQIFSNPE
jgi:hypothetical protein